MADSTFSSWPDVITGDWHPQMQEQLSHLIAKTTTDAFVAIDPENRVIYWNMGAEQTFGWRADEIIGESLQVIVPESHRAGHTAGMLRLSKGNQPRLVGKMTNVPALNRDGRTLAIELSLTHWHDPATGKPAGYAAIMRDVTERHQLEAERNAYQRKLEEQLAAMEASSDGIAMTDAEGFFTYMNKAHSRIFGYKDPSALVGRHWTVLYTTEEAELLKRVAIPSVLKTGSWTGEARGQHCEGHVIEQEVALAMSSSGGLVCTTRDMGERKQVARERIRSRESLLLAERQELINRAVSGLVHDFGNFMAVISASAATLGRKVDPRPPELERIEGAARQASAMLDLVLAPDRVKPAEMALDAKQALATVVELTAVTLKPYHSIQFREPADSITLRAAGTEFLRVMMNVCNNARDALATHQAGSITITLELLRPEKRLAKRVVGADPAKPSAVITVTDTGCGIEEGELARIFEPFRTNKSLGTGLGLAVVSSVVAEAGGSIHVRSGSRGTMFQIVWPLAGDGGPQEEVKEHTSAPVLQGANILIVDDNASVLDLIASEVRKTKANVTEVLGPMLAIETLESNAVGWDAAILDYDMPDMNGAELAARIRDRWPQLPIILCTALHEAEMSVSAALFDDRVIKSAIAGDLNNVLAQAISTSKARPS
jgi:PAS domain S-box-containing protein